MNLFKELLNSIRQPFGVQSTQYIPKGALGMAHFSTDQFRPTHSSIVLICKQVHKQVDTYILVLSVFTYSLAIKMFLAVMFNVFGCFFLSKGRGRRGECQGIFPIYSAKKYSSSSKGEMIQVAVITFCRPKWVFSEWMR